MRVTREEDRTLEESPSAPAPGALSQRAKVSIMVVVVVALVAVLALRGGDAPPPGAQSIDTGTQAPAAGADPVALYEEAREAGMPTYILFHSATCPSCIEITATSVRILPEYADSIIFVDALTDDPRTRPLFSIFQFQYIPTLFFVGADGSVVDQHVGPLTEEELRARLDVIAAQAPGGADAGDGS